MFLIFFFSHSNAALSPIKNTVSWHLHSVTCTPIYSLSRICWSFQKHIDELAHPLRHMSNYLQPHHINNLVVSTSTTALIQCSTTFFLDIRPIVATVYLSFGFIRSLLNESSSTLGTMSFCTYNSLEQKFIYNQK